MSDTPLISKEHGERILDLQTERDQLRRELESERESHSLTIIEREGCVEHIEEIAVKLGCEKEWTSEHDHWTCVSESVDQLRRKRDAAVAALKETLHALPPGQFEKLSERIRYHLKRHDAGEGG